MERHIFRYLSTHYQLVKVDCFFQKLVSSFKLFLTDAISPVFSIVLIELGNNKDIAWYQAAHLVPFVIASNLLTISEPLHSILCNEDSSPVLFWSEHCRYTLGRFQKRLKFFHLLGSTILFQIYLVLRKLLCLFRLHCIQVKHAINKHSALDNANNQDPIIIICSSFRILFINYVRMVGIVYSPPNNSIYIRNFSYFSKQDSNNLIFLLLYGFRHAK